MKKTFYPVIHVETLQQTLINAGYAYANGADGIFLINHAISNIALLKIYQEVRRQYPDRWIGLNFLGYEVEDAMQALPADANGLWTDHAGIEESGDNHLPRRWYSEFKKTHPDSTYFGGVAFKYQRRVEDLESAAARAQACMDVICTSGAGTGIAAAIPHVQRLSSAKGEKSLALASGVTPENLAGFLSCADSFLVATGISRSFHMLDPEKVAELARQIKAYNTEKML